MSLASTVPGTAIAGTRSHTHYPNASFFKSNLKPKLASNSWRHNPPPIIPHVMSSNNIDTLETTPKIISMAVQHKPLDTEPSSTDAHGLSRSKSVWVNPNKPRKSVHGHSKNVTGDPHTAALRLCAKKLDSCDPNSDAIFGALDSLEETLSSKDAMLIMNNIQGWQKAYYFFQWLNKNEYFQMNSVIYNVTMKVLRRGRQWNKVEELLLHMIGRGIEPDNITYSTVISCARQCSLPHKAVEWYERMIDSGCVPNEITNTAMIDAYSRAGKVNEALNLYERARADGWCPDVKAFATMLKMYSLSGDIDGVLYTFQEMKALGVKPNLVAYNTMFDALAKAGKKSDAKALFKEMTDAGLAPDQVTLTCLLKIYGKARWAHDALKLWDQMKEEGWKKDVIAYNTLLRMCADLGRMEKAVMLFEEMHQSDDCKPDSWSYTSMIDIFTRGGQVEEADRMFNEMVEAGFRPTVMVYTCLIQCYGRAKRFDDVVRIFNLLCDEGITPDDKLCGSLLSVLTLSENKDLDKVLKCIKKVNPKLFLVVKMLQKEKITLVVLQKELEIVFNKVSDEVQRPYFNCLIDLCYNFNFPDRAHYLLRLGTESGIYTNLYTKSRTEWSLNLCRLSFKAALTAFDDWLSSLSKALEVGEEIPPLLAIRTGHGTHKHSSDQGLVALFGSHLREIDSPFEKSTKRVGWFLASRDAAISWLQSRKSSVLIAA